MRLAEIQTMLTENGLVATVVLNKRRKHIRASQIAACKWRVEVGDRDYDSALVRKLISEMAMKELAPLKVK
jgi:hypothetical protein